MAGKARRKRARSFRNAPRVKEWTSGTAGDWLERWKAAAPHAAAMYAEAVRHQAEAAIAKYRESLERSLKLKQGDLRQCRGA